MVALNTDPLTMTESDMLKNIFLQLQPKRYSYTLGSSNF